jgi:hypothetical protein
MANQMIALQTRNPQLPDPSRAAAQYANMMNMASQQRATQLQAERTRQEMDYARASEGRAAQTQTSNMRKADLEYQIEDMKRLRNIGATVLRSGNEDAYQDLLGMITESDPQFGNLIRRVAPTFNPDVLQTVIMEADKFIDKSVATPVASLELGMDNMPRSVTVGGLSPQQSPVYDAPGPQALRTPVATPAAAAAGTPMRATRGANTTPQDLMQQGMDPRNIPSGMPTARPISFNQSDMGGAGQMSPDMVPAILDSAINTGVMAQIDLDQIIAMSPPQARQGIMDVIRSNRIALQADAPSLAASAMDQQQPMAPNPVGRQQSQFAVMRGKAPPASLADLGGQPEMQNVMAQTQPRTITRLQQRNPNVSPLPGSAQVPLSRVAGEAEARRETPAQITQRKNAELLATEAFEEANKDKRIDRKVQEVFATKRAEKDADFLETYTDTVSKSRATLNALDQMIGDARIERDRIVIPKGGRRPHGGFEGVVGAGIPGVRFIQGTQAAGFDALLEQVQGGAFLKAFNDLRGGGAITQIEGEKATTALTRVRRAQSEIEFVKAAREFVEILRNGIKNADKRYARLTGEAPPAAPTQRKTTTSTLSAATRKKYGL